MILGGELLSPQGPVAGFVQVEEGMTVAWGLGPPPVEPDAVGLLAPSFVDAHTHLGDAALYGERVPRSLEEAVAPPGGFKHLRLAQMEPAHIVAATRARLAAMAEMGTGCAVDFREDGAEGAALLREAAEGTPLDLVLLGRPGPRDLDGLQGLVHGIGLSALRDVGPAEATRLAAFARSFEGLFAMHHAEEHPEPVEALKDLRPDLAVHLNRVDPSGLRALAEAGIGLVTCPRSNRHFALDPMGPRALDAGLVPMLGTDNAMLSDGDLLAEANALLALCPDADEVTLAVLQGLTYVPRLLLGLPAPRWAQQLFALPEPRRLWGGIPLAGAGGEGCRATLFFEGWQEGFPARGGGFLVIPSPPEP